MMTCRIPSDNDDGCGGRIAPAFLLGAEVTEAQTMLCDAISEASPSPATPSRPGCMPGHLLEAPRAALECRAGYEPGDEVELVGPSVAAEFRGKTAVVMSVAEGATHCTAVALNEQRRGVGQCWPNLCDLRLRGCSWRIGTRVVVDGLRSEQRRSLNGSAGVIVEHPSEGHPSFISRAPSAEFPQLTFCIRLDQPWCGRRSLLLEPKFFQPEALKAACDLAELVASFQGCRIGTPDGDGKADTTASGDSAASTGDATEDAECPANDVEKTNTGLSEKDQPPSQDQEECPSPRRLRLRSRIGSAPLGGVEVFEDVLPGRWEQLARQASSIRLKSLGSASLELPPGQHLALLVNVLAGAVLAFCLHSVEQRLHRKVFHIHEIVVGEALRGQGLGTALLCWCFSYAAAMDCDSVELTCPSGLAAFLEPCGFQAIEQLDIGWRWQLWIHREEEEEEAPAPAPAQDFRAPGAALEPAPHGGGDDDDAAGEAARRPPAACPAAYRPEEPGPARRAALGRTQRGRSFVGCAPWAAALRQLWPPGPGTWHQHRRDA